MDSEAPVSSLDPRGSSPAVEDFDAARIGDRDRLLAVRRSRLLDSRQEAAFDRLTRRACVAIGVPVALVSVVDADRQFFKSEQGLHEPFASARQTPLSHSLCQYVVAGERPLVVSDARRVPFLAHSQAIPALGVIGYAGVPLRAHGFVLGAFCAIDSEPHEWSAEDLAALEELADACSTEIHLRAALREGRRAQAELRFHHLGGMGQETGHGGRPPTRAQATATGRAPTGGDDRRWRRRQLAIPLEAAL